MGESRRKLTVVPGKEQQAMQDLAYQSDWEQELAEMLHETADALSQLASRAEFHAAHLIGHRKASMLSTPERAVAARARQVLERFQQERQQKAAS